jgi:hypothetical protein
MLVIRNAPMEKPVATLEGNPGSHSMFDNPRGP